MKILFDNQCFYLHGKGGISNYISNLISSLMKIEDVEVVFQGHQVYDFFIDSKEIKIRNIKGLNRIKLELAKKKDLKFIKKNIDKVDYYFPTYYHPDFLPYLKKTNSGVIIHDMIHEKFPELAMNAEKYSNWKSNYIESSSLFFTVSESTLMDLVDFFPKTGKYCHVIYPGRSFPLFVESKKRGELSYLFVGNRSGYKNFKFLNDKMILAEIKKLILVGGGILDSEEKAFLDNVNTELHNPDEKELVQLYQESKALLSTSIYEGFGLPLLEAMENDTPIIVFDTPVAREVTLNQANYFSNVEELKELLQKTELNTFRGKFPYSWKRSSEKLYSILRGL